MRAKVWHCASFEFDLSSPFIAGICNVTPDSFSDGGVNVTTQDALDSAHKMLDAGADIIDVGGESTRPGSDEVRPEDELARVLPVVRELAAQGVAVSIDTRHPRVAAECVDSGACIINDVTGFRDRAMRDIAAQSDVGLIVMHMRGEPKTMQDNPEYENPVDDVEHELLHMADRLRAEGVEPERICLDPGVGFGKRGDHNQALVQATARFADLGYPLMGAVSRKSFIGIMTGIEVPADRDRASALCAAFMANQGARIMRVHNVALTREMIKKSHRVVLGLGSNMGNACGHIDKALEDLRSNPDIWVGAVSRYMESEPAYMKAQASFVNAVAAIQTTLGPYELLDVLHDLEAGQGRTRMIPNGPRTLDLDIVDYEGITSDDAVLTLPHPLALERDFVVTPLLDALPGYTLANGVSVTRDGISVGRVSGPAQDHLFLRGKDGVE